MMLAVLSLWLLFYRLGVNTLSNWDEAWLAAVAQGSGWWNGERWLYEPPLVTWVLSLMIKFSQSEWWLRSFNAASGVVLVMVVYWTSKKLFKSKLAGIISALVLLSTIEWLFRARQINVDIPLSLWLFLAVTLKSGFFLGLAAMTKRLSWLLAVPALIWVWRKKGFWREIGLFLLVALPWHAYSYLILGREFVDKYLLGFSLGKLTAVNPVTGSSPLFYIEALRHGMKLWFLILPIALIWGLRQKTLLIFVATYWVGLTLSPIKASWYMLSIYPVVALLIGGFLNQIFKYRRSLGLTLVIAVFLFNLLKWRREWLVPQTTLHQATLAKEVKAMTKPDEVLYLDDDWLPVAVFYSQRKVIPLRFNRGERYSNPLNLPMGSLVLTNEETLGNLRQRLNGEISAIKQNSDLLLVRIIP